MGRCGAGDASGGLQFVTAGLGIGQGSGLRHRRARRRRQGRFRQAVHAAAGLPRRLILLPLVLPPVVGGIALLYTFGRLGLLGQYLDAAGIRIAFTTTAVVLSQTFVSLPFLVIAFEGAARTVGTEFDVVAATLGARPTTVWRRVSLPLLAPG